MNSDMLLPSGKAPLHVALLPDGARRWAVANERAKSVSYAKSAVHLADVVTAIFGPLCDEITLLLSNWRNHLRIDSDREAFEIGIRNFIALAYERGESEWQCELRFICPSDLWASLGIRSKSEGAASRRLNVCIAYDPLEELKSACKEAGSVDSPSFSERVVSNLAIPRPVDLAIRTGGKPLFSGFIPLQVSYARIYCFDDLFNDVHPKQYNMILEEFSRLSVVYGT